MKIYPLVGTVQHYEWGGKQFISQFIGVENPSQKPMAEYWLGAHNNAPSLVNIEVSKTQPLNEFIQNNPADILGENIYQSFGRLPFLFKILDVKDMLSIQVHPSKEAAVIAFEEENKKGIPLNAPHRNYKDDNHKPELMVALSDFWLLHGFKPVADLKKTLANTPCLEYLLPIFEDGNYQALYQEVMWYDESKVKAVFEKHINSILPQYHKGELKKSDENFWVARAYETFCKQGYDKGLFSIYFFNIVHLKVGEAIFQDAGVPHAYLEGQNLELMANSDNVLRGGLTPKHVDVPELLQHIKFEATHPNVLHGSLKNQEWVFETPAKDFELRKISLKAGETISIVTNGPSIFLVEKGSTKLPHFIMKKGAAAFAAAHENISFTAEEESVIYHATTP